MSKAMDRPVWPWLQQVLEARVGLLGRAEAGEHAHGPEPAAVAGGVDATREGIAAGQAQVTLVVEVVRRRPGCRARLDRLRRRWW